MDRALQNRQPWWHPQVRKRKAQKILAVLDDFLGEGFRRETCLDVGCSRGTIAATLAGRFSLVVGVDVDAEALREAAGTFSSDNVVFVGASGLELPFPAGTFDIVVCAQVYEHVGDAPALFSEIRRVLRDGGTCFFSGPNRLSPVEAHHSLPFLHWLPGEVASRYLRTFGKGRSYEERPLSLWRLRRLMAGFEIVDYTARMIADPVFYRCVEEVRPRWFSRIPKSILDRLSFAFPNYNWVLRKRV